MITTGKGAKREREDYQISRYTCYLIVLADDESKPVVAPGKVYFAVQTRRQGKSISNGKPGTPQWNDA